MGPSERPKSWAYIDERWPPKTSRSPFLRDPKALELYAKYSYLLQGFESSYAHPSPQSLSKPVLAPGGSSNPALSVPHPDAPAAAQPATHPVLAFFDLGSVIQSIIHPGPDAIATTATRPVPHQPPAPQPTPLPLAQPSGLRPPEPQAPPSLPLSSTGQVKVVAQGPVLTQPPASSAAPAAATMPGGAAAPAVAATPGGAAVAPGAPLPADAAAIQLRSLLQSCSPLTQDHRTDCARAVVALAMASSWDEFQRQYGAGEAGGAGSSGGSSAGGTGGGRGGRDTLSATVNGAGAQGRVALLRVGRTPCELDTLFMVWCRCQYPPSRIGFPSAAALYEALGTDMARLALRPDPVTRKAVHVLVPLDCWGCPISRARLLGNELERLRQQATEGRRRSQQQQQAQQQALQGKEATGGAGAVLRGVDGGRDGGLLGAGVASGAVHGGAGGEVEGERRRPQEQASEGEVQPPPTRAHHPCSLPGGNPHRSLLGRIRMYLAMVLSPQLVTQGSRLLPISTFINGLRTAGCVELSPQLLEELGHTCVEALLRGRFSDMVELRQLPAGQGEGGGSVSEGVVVLVPTAYYSSSYTTSMYAGLHRGGMPAKCQQQRHQVWPQPPQEGHLGTPGPRESAISPLPPALQPQQPLPESQPLATAPQLQPQPHSSQGPLASSKQPLVSPPAVHAPAPNSTAMDAATTTTPTSGPDRMAPDNAPLLGPMEMPPIFPRPPFNAAATCLLAPVVADTAVPVAHGNIAPPGTKHVVLPPDVPPTSRRLSDADGPAISSSAPSNTTPPAAAASTSVTAGASVQLSGDGGGQGLPPHLRPRVPAKRLQPAGEHQPHQHSHQPPSKQQHRRIGTTAAEVRSASAGSGAGAAGAGNVGSASGSGGQPLHREWQLHEGMAVGLVEWRAADAAALGADCLGRLELCGDSCWQATVYQDNKVLATVWGVNRHDIWEALHRTLSNHLSDVTLPQELTDLRERC